MNYNELTSKHAPNEHKWRFFYSRLLQCGISEANNQFMVQNEERPQYFNFVNPDNAGNVRFYVKHLNNKLAQYTSKNSIAGQTKLHDWYLTRYETPVKTKAGIAKYMPPKQTGCPVFMIIPNNVLDAIKNKTKIDTLVIVEGYFKALSLAEHGVYAIGMSGLDGFAKTKDEKPADQQNIDFLKDDLKEILKTGLVQRVAVMHDGDNMDISKAKDRKETARPNLFYLATVKAKRLIEHYADVVYIHPKSDLITQIKGTTVNLKGIDDLLLAHRTISHINSELPRDKFNYKSIKVADGEKKIIKDLLTCVSTRQPGEYFSVCPLSGVSDHRVREYFALDAPDAFFKAHRAELIKRERFWFYNKYFTVKPDGTIEMAEDQANEYIPIEERVNKLYVIEDKRNREIANFTIRVLYQVESAENPVRVCKVTNFMGVSRIVELTPQHFAGLMDFKKKFIALGNFVWRGKAADLENLMILLFRNETKALSIQRIGWQPDNQFFAFTNGIVTNSEFLPVDDNGILEYNGETYYLPFWSKFNPQNWERYQEDRKTAHISSNNAATFAQWKTLITEVFGDNGNLFFAWAIASLYSDFIFQQIKFFPLFFAGGQPQSGKTTMIDHFGHMFGRPRSIVSLAGLSTPKYFANRFAQYRNGWVHLDEFGMDKNPKIIDFCKDLYNRIGYGTKAFTNDNQTNEIPVLCGAALSGELFPTDNFALFTRTIIAEFNKTVRTDKSREAFSQLEKIHANGITHITIEFLKCRENITDNFNDEFSEAFNRFNAYFKKKSIDDRMLKNMAAIFAPVKILLDTKKFQFDFDEHALFSLMCRVIEKQNEMGKENTDLAKFFDIIEILFRDGKLSENAGDFLIQEDVIYIRTLRFQHLYSEYARKIGLNKILDKSTLENYFATHPAYIDNMKNGRREQKRFKNSNTPTTCFMFNYSKLGIDLVKSDYDPEDDKNQEIAPGKDDKPF